MNSTDNALHCHYMQNDEECPSTEVCYTGKDYHLVSRWLKPQQKEKESWLSVSPFCSCQQFSICFQIPLFKACNLGKEAMILIV